jgi:hypothetical protein
LIVERVRFPLRGAKGVAAEIADDADRWCRDRGDVGSETFGADESKGSEVHARDGLVENCGRGEKGPAASHEVVDEEEPEGRGFVVDEFERGVVLEKLRP